MGEEEDAEMAPVHETEEQLRHLYYEQHMTCMKAFQGDMNQLVILEFIGHSCAQSEGDVALLCSTALCLP